MTVERTFVLDHQFPAMVIKARLPEASLVPLASVDPSLVEDVDDWAILVALSQRKPQVHGFITGDEGMLAVPKVLAVLLQTSLSLVVCAGTGHDAIAATGLVLLHLPAIARRWADHPQLWIVRRPGPREPEEIKKRIGEFARHAREKPADFLRRHQLTHRELTSPLASWYTRQESLPLEDHR